MPSTATLHITPHIRAVGSGPPILCLHSSTSSSRQWTGLMETVGRKYRVVAADLFGYGKTLPWPNHRPLTLDDEVELVAPIVLAAGEPVHLVGHSYGGAVAAKVALHYRQRIASLTLYEPVLFNLLFQDRHSAREGAEIKSVEAEVRSRAAAQDYPGATKRFIDYWSGPGTWNTLPEWRRQKLSEKILKVVSDFEAVFGEATSLSEYGRLEFPTMLLYGVQSPSASRRVIELLGQILPHAEVRGLLGAGHMGPVTHPDQVNHAVARFLRKLSLKGSDTVVMEVPVTKNASA